jgi:hypothetical protein
MANATQMVPIPAALESEIDHRSFSEDTQSPTLKQSVLWVKFPYIYLDSVKHARRVQLELICLQRVVTNREL